MRANENAPAVAGAIAKPTAATQIDRDNQSTGEIIALAAYPVNRRHERRRAAWERRK